MAGYANVHYAYTPTLDNNAPRPIPHDHRFSPASSPHRLPSGPCNYRHLDAGNGSLGCGCRQFWQVDDASTTSSRGSGYNTTKRSCAERSERATCYCGHHACFHDASQTASPASAQLGGLFQAYTEAGPFRHQRSYSAVPPSSSRPVPADDYFDCEGREPDPSRIGCGQPVMQTRLDRGRYGKLSYEPETRRIANSVSREDVRPSSGLGLYVEATRHATSQMPPPPFFLSSSHKLRHSHLPSTQSSVPPSEVSSNAFQPRQSPSNAFLDHVANMRHNIHPIEASAIPAPPEDAAQSVTEVATPSNSGTPALTTVDQLFENVKRSLQQATDEPLGTNSQEHDTTWNGVSTKTVKHLLSEMDSLRAALFKTDNFRVLLLGLSNRIDALEAASFSYIPIDELQEKLELFEGRILDVEGKVEDLENAAQARDDDHASSASYFKRQGRGRAAQTGLLLPRNVQKPDFAAQQPSQASSSGMPAEAISRLYELENRLMQLETDALPTTARPWEVELVLLPWGPNLQGIWCNAAASTQTNYLDSAPGNARPTNVQDATQSYLQSQTIQEWNNGADRWLSPRACGPTNGLSGKVYERLKSRGFVKTVEFTANGATEIQSLVAAAFGDLLGVFDQRRSQTPRTQATDVILGLQTGLVPLRKIHRSSQLRFLTKSELVTPSTWTADFLNSSVFMKAPSTGQRRLYLTVPSAYLQQGDNSSQWTWQNLRELPRKESGYVGEADALEPCWAWDMRLDPPISVHSSLSSGLSYHNSFASTHPISPQPTRSKTSAEDGSESSQSEADETSEDELGMSYSPIRDGSGPVTPTSGSTSRARREMRFRRTASLPLESYSARPDPIPKRQAASFEQSASPVKADLAKRRRLSKTPDAIVAGVGSVGWAPTPRRSREPPSPQTYNASSFAVTTGQLGGRSIHSKRGVTPQAYATPHSNEIDLEHGETDADRDVDVDESSGVDGDLSEDGLDDDDEEDDESGHSEVADEEAWEGVRDDHEMAENTDESGRMYQAAQPRSVPPYDFHDDGQSGRYLDDGDSSA